MTVVLAIDAGTTGIRTIAFDERGAARTSAYAEFPQYFPQPGWVEHDPTEIWNTTLATLHEVLTALNGESIAAIGVTNQRETIVMWDRRTGQPLHRALVWQDRRTAATCDAMRANGDEPAIRVRTGLVLDPYFSATKLQWLIRSGAVAVTPDTLVGTIDTWIIWNLSGGADGGVHVTDASNASRTLLYDLDTCTWSPELCAQFDLPMHTLARVANSAERVTHSAPAFTAGRTIPISGIAGDQQAALFGQACVTPGMTKNTYGTGSFVLMNVGTQRPAPVDGLLTTVAWSINDVTTYALEGAIFVTGAAIQWLRDGLGIIDHATETGPLAASVPTTDGVYFVPALTGLGSPYWDAYARGTIVGLTRGTTRAHIARATVEAMTYLTTDVVRAMTSASGTAVAELRVDGGASAMDLLCQMQADMLRVDVRRPQVQETTALGAAYLAGLAEDVWPSPDALSWQQDAHFTPNDGVSARLDEQYRDWQRAVERARGWATD
jgi:glycerol kinase